MGIERVPFFTERCPDKRESPSTVRLMAARGIDRCRLAVASVHLFFISKMRQTFTCVSACAVEVS